MRYLSKYLSHLELLVPVLVFISVGLQKWKAGMRDAWKEEATAYKEIAERLQEEVVGLREEVRALREENVQLRDQLNRLLSDK
ncbi:hypothetical protein [Streptomyces cacaoi]|uniref:Uncharacterized protein n=1 Tax=Streptomyces cacaoi TaxID=1898 RepID=A0A4Y3QYC8_STRCI|nr:hypothetical protein [Streptomyces cacaoi]GEB50456.1 hypothetical protein SCA03_30070 [Streptomyces cacaoi]